MTDPICALCGNTIHGGEGHEPECLVTPNATVGSDQEARAWRAGVAAARLVVKIAATVNKRNP